MLKQTVRIWAMVLALFSTACTFAGTYSVVGVDTSLMTWQDTSRVSFSQGGSANSFPVWSQFTGGLSHGGASNYVDYALDTVQGQVTWTIEWTPSSPGETPPQFSTVKIWVKGHCQATAAVQGYSGINGTFFAQTTITDRYFNGSATNTGFNDPNHADDSFGDTTDRTLATEITDSSSYTEVAPGVYHSTVVWSFNTGVSHDLQLYPNTGVWCTGSTSVNMYERFKILKIDDILMP